MKSSNRKEIVEPCPPLETSERNVNSAKFYVLDSECLRAWLVLSKVHCEEVKPIGLESSGDTTQHRGCKSLSCLSCLSILPLSFSLAHFLATSLLEGHKNAFKINIQDKPAKCKLSIEFAMQSLVFTRTLFINRLCSSYRAHPPAQSQFTSSF